MCKNKISVSAEPVPFRLNRIFDQTWAKMFPGASWLPLLKKNLESEYEVVTADVAVSHVENGFWSAEDVFVIQHADDPLSKWLIKNGSFPLAIMCFESPLYVGKFYDAANEIALPFRHRILFSGLYELSIKESETNHQVAFPSYSLDDLVSFKDDWSNRRKIVAVIANKYIASTSPPPLFSIFEYLWWMLKRIIQFFNGLKQSRRFPVNAVQLQEARLEYIEFFMERGLLDLFGARWDKLYNLPPHWQKRLRKIFRQKLPSTCENKLETISKYRYGLCIENASFPGYVTEKIIECLVAGIIPLYLGAPDIAKYIPTKCFIDLRNYSSKEDLVVYLENISEETAKNMIASGYQFLISNQGKIYSYEGFAELIATIVRAETKA